MSSIAVSVTAACPQCHFLVPVNALAFEAACPECMQKIPVDMATWRKLLMNAAVEGPNAAPGESHLEAFRSGQMQLIRNYVRKEALCTKCKAPIPLPRGLQGADHGFCICVKCGDKIAVRAVPADLQFQGITHLIAEAQESTPKQRLFYLWHERPANAAAQLGDAAMKFDWHDLHDVVVDQHGNLYFLTDDQFHFWSVDPQFRPRWSRPSIAMEKGDRFNDPQLVPTPSGFVVLYARSRHGAIVLSCADGSTAANLGGREPPGSPVHFFDMKDCDTLTCDVDGTLVGAIHDRLLRWTYDGHAVETWPPTKGIFGGEKHQQLHSLYRMVPGSEEREAVRAGQEYPPRPEDVGNHPYEIRSGNSELLVGRDGMLVFLHSSNVAKLDRTGNVLFKAVLPEPDNSWRGRPQTDGYGNIYFLCSAPHDSQRIMRISADGRDIRPAVDGTRIVTPIRDGNTLVVAPDGTMYVFGSYGRARVFNADGTVRFLSDKAREDDQDAARERELEER